MKNRQPSSSGSVGRITAGPANGCLVATTMEFVWNSLASWRDHPDRPSEVAEEALNAQLSMFLSAKASQEFPMVQFHHEQRQTQGRRVDMSAHPTSPVIICGTYFSIFRPITLMEGKRIPPPEKAREKEYVTGGDKQSGGIQRFKLGLHGKDHEKVMLIGYVQKGAFSDWQKTINQWIVDLASSQKVVVEKWEKAETLSIFTENRQNKTCRLQSTHGRYKDASGAIEIHHLWVAM